MKKQTLTFLALLVSVVALSQNCDCKTNFVWLKDFFKQNDAGFQYAINAKGQKAYASHNEEILQKVTAIKDKNECYSALHNWLKFFRKGHFGIWANDVFKYGENDLGEINKISVDVSAFCDYLSKEKIAPYEGVWDYMGELTIGVKKIAQKYVGFILTSTHKGLEKGQIVFEIIEQPDKTTAILYSQNKKKLQLNTVQLFSNKYMLLEFIVLQRLAPNSISPAPSFKQLNAATCLLTIPSFEASCKKAIDSIINVNKHLITHTATLIIDIRNNGGGSSGSYNSIIALLYSNPIQQVGLEILATKENGDRYLEQAEATEDKKELLDIYNKIKNSSGEFINPNDKPVQVLRFDTIYTYPQKVGIIINENCGSAAEQFLLAAKQSQKVKLFGVSTMGEIDISNVWFKESPCKNFKLAYAVSKTLRVPGMPVDGNGVQPDFYLDASIPHETWIEYTQQLLNGLFK